jgi:zona occludens toxin (predicted ATPase)
VLVGVAHSVAVPQTDALDINVSCTLTDRWGNVLAHAARGAATPPVVATAVATPNSTPYRLCGSAYAYFRGGRSLSASGCGNAVPGV